MLTLTQKLDSLVRVSRRVEKSHFVNVIARRDFNSSTLGPLHSRSRDSLPQDYTKLAPRTQSSVEIRLHTRRSEFTAANNRSKRQISSNSQLTLTCTDEKHYRKPAPITARGLRSPTAILTISYSNLAAINWFHSLPS